MIYSAEAAYEVILIALMLYREARGEANDAKLAVAWSLRNRVKHPTTHWWGKSWVGCILKPKQYSSFNANDPNVTVFPIPPDAAWDACVQAAQLVHSAPDSQPDGIDGATHYYSGDVIPSWAGTMTFVRKVGNFQFFR